MVLAIPSMGYIQTATIVRSILKNKITSSFKKELLRPTKIYTSEIIKLTEKI